MIIIVSLLALFSFVKTSGVLAYQPTVCVQDGDCSVVSRDTGSEHLCFGVLCHPWDNKDGKAESLGFLNKCKRPSDCKGVNETCIFHHSLRQGGRKGLCIKDFTNVTCSTHEDCNELKCVNKQCADPTFLTALTEAQWAILFLNQCYPFSMSLYLSDIP